MAKVLAGAAAQRALDSAKADLRDPHPGQELREGLQGCHSRATCGLAPCHRSHQEHCMGTGRQPCVMRGQLGRTKTLWRAYGWGSWY